MTLYRSGNIAQAAREIKRRGIDVMGINETHWTGKEKCNSQRAKLSFTPEEMMTTIGRELAY